MGLPVITEVPITRSEIGPGYTAFAACMAAEPKRCEYERVWETRCTNATTTSGESQLIYRAYTCPLHFCRNPDVLCRVKGSALVIGGSNGL